MKIIKESVNTQYEVGLIPAGAKRYKTLEELLDVFKTFDEAKECVLSYNHIINSEYAGYDIVIVTSDDTYSDSDWACDTEVYRLDGISVNNEDNDTFCRFYVYDDADDVVSDEFTYEDDAIAWAKERNYPTVKQHNYFYDERGKIRPDDGPDVVWTSAPINEGVLNEGPLDAAKRFFKGIGKSADDKARMERDDAEKAARKKAEKVLANDLTSKAKDWLYYVPDASGKYPKTPITNKDFLNSVGQAKPGTPEYEQRCNALVVDKDGMYIRRGLEWLQGKGAKANPAAPKIKPSFTHDEVFTGSSESDGAAAESETSSETPAEEETPAVTSSDTATTDKTYAKFALLAKATGVKVIGPRGGTITKLSQLKKINDTNAANIKVEVAGKTYKLPDYLKVLKDNKLLEDAILTEKVWKHKINKEVAFRLRDALEADLTDYEELREAMKACYDDIHAAMPEVFDEDDCNDAKEELDWLSTSSDEDADYDDPEYMDDDALENDWNYALEDLYDLCDNLNVWIPVRGIDEDLSESDCNESLLQDLNKDHKAIETRYGKEVYDALDEYIELGNDLQNVLYKEIEWNNFVDWLQASKGITLHSNTNSSFEDALSEAVKIAGQKLAVDYRPAFKEIAEEVDGRFDFISEFTIDNDRIIVTITRPINKADLTKLCDAMNDTKTCKENKWEAVYTGMQDDNNMIIQFQLKQDLSVRYTEDTSPLTEAPVIKLTDDDIMTPGKIDFKQKIADATAEEEAEKARQAEEARKEQFRVKYKDVPVKLEASLGKGADAEETLEVLFEDLVPSEGAADTAAGEMVRAMMRVLYRDANDGDKFFMGYGLETCASSVAYLCSMIPVIDKHVDVMLEEAFRYVDDDEAYTKQLNQMTEEVVDHIMNNQELIFTPNEEDSRDYDYDYIEEKQPRYEFECDGSDDVCTLVNEGILTGWDLYHYVEDQLQWDNAYKGAEVERPWGYDSTSITVSNLTVEGYEQLKDSFERNSEGWWEDLVSEHQDELDRINNGEYDEDDEIDENFAKSYSEICEKLQAQSEDLTFLANQFDEALTEEGFNYDIDIVEGFKINVKSEDLKAIDDFANEFFKKYNLAVNIEDKSDSHNYLLRKAATKTSKNEGYVDAFKPVEEKLNEEFISYEDVMQGMMDNASEEQIDADLRLFNKIAKNLGLKKPEDIVIYVDEEGLYNPVYYAESSTKINAILTKFEIGPVSLIAEIRNGNVWCYFNNADDANMYLGFVNKENGI